MAEKPHVWLDTKAVTKKTKKGKSKILCGPHKFITGSSYTIDHKRKSKESPELEAQELVINFGGNDEVCVCMRVCVHACVHVCVCACVHACV